MKSFQNLLFVLLTITLAPILTARTAGPADAVTSLIAAPQPDYPTAARRDSLQGRGLFLIRFDSDSGRTSSVSVIHSTGHAILDEAAVKALRRWQIRPHTCDAINVPISFGIDSGMTEERDAAIRSAGNNLLYAPSPVYPLAARASGVMGKGRFQLFVDPRTGLVTDVQTLKTTHDTRLDAAAVKALRQWRFKPNTVRKLTVPINFSFGYG